LWSDHSIVSDTPDRFAAMRLGRVKAAPNGGLEIPNTHRRQEQQKE
jgi:hypothetical protein